MAYIPDDRLLTEYLLRCLPEQEMDRLDQLSIADDDFAARLSSAENDLVDAYVRDELAAGDAVRFKSSYLSSPKRREKVQFAQALLSLQRRAAVQPVMVHPGRGRAQPRQGPWAGLLARMGTTGSAGGWLPAQWGWAGAALLLLIASGYLLDTNRQLHRQLSRSESDRAALVERENDLANQAAARTAATEAAPQVAIDRLQVAAFVLVPSLRGSGPLPAVSWSASTDLLVLKLQLEATEFARYQVVIENSATRQAVWQSPDLAPASEGGRQVLSFGFRPALMKSANYLVRLSGVRADGSRELLTSYPFRAVVK